MDKREIEKPVAHTIVLSVGKLPRKLQHPIFQVGLNKIYQNSTKRQGWIGYHLNILSSSLDQKYPQHS